MIFCQIQKNSSRHFGLKIEMMTLFPYPDEFGNWNTEYEKDSNTVIYGVQAGMTYYFEEIFGIGLGTGIEKVSQPEFSYFPLFLNGVLLFSVSPKTII